MHLDWCISEEIVFGQRIKRLKGSKDKKLKNSTDEIKDHVSIIITVLKIYKHYECYDVVI